MTNTKPHPQANGVPHETLSEYKRQQSENSNYKSLPSIFVGLSGFFVAVIITVILSSLFIALMTE